MINISCIIVTFNCIDDTKNLIKDLDKQCFNKETIIDFIFVDNGSHDGTVNLLQKRKFQLIKNKNNLGFAKAVNQGIAYANKESDIILLNNDIRLKDNNSLQKLITISRSNSDIGILGVKILQKSKKLIQHCGVYPINEDYHGFQIASNEVDINQYSGLHQTHSVVFACVLIKRLVVQKINLLSEEFFAYFEDTDFCMRAAQHGIKTFITGDVVVLHQESTTSKKNNLNKTKIFKNSQQIFKNKWKDYVEYNKNKKSIDWHSIINFPSGYANSSREFIKSLDNSNISMRYKYIYGKNSPFPVAEKNITDPILTPITKRKFGKADVEIVYAQGDVFKKNKGKYKIGFTMLEVDGLPLEWVKQANSMDEIWVPSSFNKKTFQDSGVNVPIHIIPLGINTAYFSPSIRSLKNKKYFQFFSNFEWGERKAPDILLRAFCDEFKKNENVKLVLKIANNDASIDVIEEIKKYKLSNYQNLVILLNTTVDYYEMGVLYNSFDCFVLPTRGEGWGMPILEAMACGLPVIATNFSSQTDFMTRNNSYPLDFEKLIKAEAKCPYYEGFNWAQPSYEHLRYLLRYVYNNQDEAKKIGHQAYLDSHTYWKWSDAAKKIVKRVKSI